MAKEIWSIKETSRGVWRATVDGSVLSDSRGFDKSGAERDARSYVAREPELRTYQAPQAAPFAPSCKPAKALAEALKASDWPDTPNTVLLARAKAAAPSAPDRFWNEVRIELNRLDGIYDE